MSDRIISLKCPSCGDARNEMVRERTFGAEFRCGSCGVTSVLVINNQLHVRQSGEHVCSDCGRVAPKGARFCQCSKSLVRKCAMCPAEFFVDDLVCPQCGWNNSTDLADWQRRISGRIESHLLAGSFIESTKDVDALLSTITAAEQAEPESDSALRRYILTTKNIQAPSDSGGFYSPEVIISRLKGVGRIGAWHKRVQDLNQQLRKIEKHVVDAGKDKCRGTDEGALIGCGALVLGFFGGLISGFSGCVAKNSKPVEFLGPTLGWIWGGVVSGGLVGLITFVAVSIIVSSRKSARQQTKLRELHAKKAELVQQLQSETRLDG